MITVCLLLGLPHRTEVPSGHDLIHLSTFEEQQYKAFNNARDLKIWILPANASLFVSNHWKPL